MTNVLQPEACEILWPVIPKWEPKDFSPGGARQESFDWPQKLMAAREIKINVETGYKVMNVNLAFALAAGIGFVAGLRSLTAPAVVCWAAHLGWINLHGTPLAFMGSAVAVGIFTVLALVELVADQLPKTPARTQPVGLIARIITGGLTGACLCAAHKESLMVGAVLGAIGGVVGAFVGYSVRTGLVKTLKVKDVLIAVPEDLVAIGLAYLIVTR